MKSPSLVVILDFGSQYTQLIARRVRELGVYSEIVPGTTPAAEIAKRKPGALILSGSPASGYRAAAPLPDPALYALKKPLLGICYGFQATAQQVGGRDFSQQAMLEAYQALYASLAGRDRV